MTAPTDPMKEASAKVVRLETKVGKIKAALSDAEAELTRRRNASHGSDSKSTEPESELANLNVTKLRTRITKIKLLNREAKRQLDAARSSLGQLAHSAFLADPDADNNFAIFKSAERNPSQ